MLVGSNGVSFLSRLCGGEYDSVCCCAVRSFLSRLCGGEYGKAESSK